PERDGAGVGLFQGWALVNGGGRPRYGGGRGSAAGAVRVGACGNPVATPPGTAGGPRGRAVVGGRGAGQRPPGVQRGLRGTAARSGGGRGAGPAGGDGGDVAGLRPGRRPLVGGCGGEYSAIVGLAAGTAGHALAERHVRGHERVGRPVVLRGGRRVG